jgi:hypothetical protein
MHTKTNEEVFRVILHLHSTQCDVRGALGCLNCDFLTRFRPKWPIFEELGEEKKVSENVCCLHLKIHAYI